MSLKSLLMPALSQRLLARERLLSRRVKAERQRRARCERHQVHYFHQVDDPYSALLAAQLPRLQDRYDVEVLAHVVPAPSEAAAPERAKLTDYSRRDAQRLAQRFALDCSDPLSQPLPQWVQRATGLLVGAVAEGRFVQVAGAISARLWQGDGRPGEDIFKDIPTLPATAAEAALHLRAADALRQRWGHYLGATLYYGGEWYWGLDRLHHLERRLQELGTARPGVADLMFPPGEDLREAARPLHPAPIDFFFSLRSPYSAIVAPRVFQLGRLTGAQVRLRFVLPMVMRGLPVPRIKRAYIVHDVAREAFMRGIPFGRLNDPVGRPTERGLAIIPLAEREGGAEQYLLSFMQGVWAEGIDAGSDRGLRKIVERAGLDWEQAKMALQDDAWRVTAEENRQAMFGLGLWGVPSFCVRDCAVWGQDRLWAVEEALLAAGDGSMDAAVAA